ncbi:nitrogen metabolite repression regulator [Diplodia corticola]|uniref:Nitrogen metabolite repression regulator n=1 Tax=Diplodia corticola TaxID=236234 RepID=A0A1J9QWV4_9PEZI|nr:nitrogen metabolite repression regulator [Diplodia corticola]OJD33478.1 nitrogen metabolite repression regulator [Diplodia corticola]
MQDRKTVVTINSTGRQSASFIRVAAAVGWQVRAQTRDTQGIVAQELSSIPGVDLRVGSLDDDHFVADLFKGAQLAFINTTHWGDEITTGRAVAMAAKKAGVEHFIYSSMPDHSIYDKGWRALPLWANKFAVENFVRQIGIPATFVYAGTYHNNFTSLPYPLFRMELQDDGSFEWQAPFHPHIPIPWLDAEHDVGPAILQIFKQGPRKWAGQRITLAFSQLTPVQVCEAFSRALNRPCRYVRGPITFHVPVPVGYREHLEILEEVLGWQNAPYFGPDLEEDCTQTALELWEGFRDIEEYAREIFPVEERANGLTWMDEDDTDTQPDDTPSETPIRDVENFFQVMNL